MAAMLGSKILFPSLTVLFVQSGKANSSSGSSGRTEEAETQGQPGTRSVRGGKQKARHERKVIDEKAEFRLISAPMRRTVKRKSEEKDISRRKQRGFSEESSGQKANS